MSLAHDLLLINERGAVLSYFEACREFWTSHGDNLNEWRQEVLDGSIPDFGGNMAY
jgi:hypothetical protein